MDIVNKFWKKYYKGNLIAREKLLDIITEKIYSIINIKGLDDTAKKHILKISLLGYFDDIMEYRATKNDE